MFIQRTLKNQLVEAVAHFPVVVVTGARQVGKTTLLTQLFPDRHYVTLDRPLAAEQAETDPEVFFRHHAPPLILDEMQYAPSLFRYLKVEVDRDRMSYGRFLLTGSQKFSLMREVQESLAGRVALLSLEGLSMEELVAGNLLPAELGMDHILEVFARGGFPELWVDREKPHRLFLDSYISTYLERDVRQVLAVGNLRDFERFLRACALRSAQVLNKSELARDVGISVPTATEWLSVLETLGQVVLLEPWFGNISKRFVKSPKLYMADPAMMVHLTGQSDRPLSQSAFIGAFWETLVFAELRKQLTARNQGGTWWFYRDQEQTEIDFVLEQGSDLTFFECKWSEHPQASDGKNMEKVLHTLEKAKSPYQVKKHVILSRVQESFRLSSQLEVRSVQGALSSE